MKLYITYTKESFTDEQINDLENVGEVIFLEETFKIDDAPYLKDNDLKILMVDPDWYDWNIEASHLSKIKNLKAVLLSTTAYDWIDLDYCRKNNIMVLNIPKYSTDSVAEYVLFLIMCLARKMPLQIKNNYKVDYSLSMLNTEIRNKTVGIIGLGTIGKRIADICSGIGMNVIYYNRTKKDTNYKSVDLDTIFESANFIVPTFSVNDETKALITDKLIKKMNGNSLINIVTKPEDIYNHKLVVERAEKGEISYAFELYDNSKNLNNYKGNIMACAPYAFYTKEAIDRLINIWCQNVISFINDENKNIVN